MFLADEKFFVPLLRNARTMKELVDDAGARIRKELKRFPEKTQGNRRSVSYCGTVNGNAVYQVSYMYGGHL